MADYKLNPPVTFELEKPELVEMVLQLNTIYKELIQVQRALPYGPGNIVIKQRITSALTSCLKLITWINISYLS